MKRHLRGTAKDGICQDARMAKIVSTYQKSIHGCSDATVLCCAETSPGRVS